MSDEDREEEEKETYRKVDKREWLREEPKEEAQEPPAGGPEAEEGAGEQEIPPEVQLDTYGLLRMCVGMFAEQAWIHLGVRLAPGAKDTATDLPQAKLAIDTLAYLKEALGDNLGAEEKREVDQLLATLRLNFVQRV